MAGSDHVAVIRLLLKDGRVQVDATCTAGGTALWYACLFGHLERARVLLMEGSADHTITHGEGTTPLVEAKQNGHRDCVKLIQVGQRRSARPPISISEACEA